MWIFSGKAFEGLQQRQATDGYVAADAYAASGPPGADGWGYFAFWHRSGAPFSRCVVFIFSTIEYL